jgi:bacterioferritin-associated ferredoxin
MYVCICKGITDTQIRDFVQNSGGNLRAVTNSLGAMTQCGKCALATREIVKQAMHDDLGDGSDLFYAVS